MSETYLQPQQRNKSNGIKSWSFKCRYCPLSPLPAQLRKQPATNGQKHKSSTNADAPRERYPYLEYLWASIAKRFGKGGRVMKKHRKIHPAFNRYKLHSKYTFIEQKQIKFNILPY